MIFKQNLKKLALEAEAAELLSEIYKSLHNEPEFQKLGDKIRSCKYEFRPLQDEITRLATEKQINHKTLWLLFLCYTLDSVEDSYKLRGYPEEMFHGFLYDILSKISECKNTDKIWGVITFEWYEKFYNLTRFAIGRLQFELMPLYLPSLTKDNITIYRGDPVINIHIPSGKKLDVDEVKKSLNDAAKFFNITYNGKTFFICRSWLIYTPYYENVFQPGSNLAKFYELFDVVDSLEKDRFYDKWRIFGNTGNLPIEELPAKTSLQRNFIKYIKDVDKHGSGIGFYIV